MSGPFGTNPPRRRPLINITPLIDVMFLLLIFFMVSSTFRSEFGIDVALPTAQTAAAQERDPYEIVVREDGTIFAGQERVDLETLRARVDALLAEDAEATLVIRADREAQFQGFISVLDLVREAGGKRVLVPATPGDAGP